MRLYPVDLSAYQSQAFGGALVSCALAKVGLPVTPVQHGRSLEEGLLCLGA